MALQIEPVSSTADLDQFALLPWSIYKGDPNWVPPLLKDFKNLFNPEKHPFYLHSEVQPFLARRDGKPVGRIAAIWNRNHQKFHDEPVGFFGFFECIDDVEVARALFAAAEEWLAARGLKTMRGPASFSSNEEWGLLIEGFDGPPRIMMTYNPRYYPALIEVCGFTKAKDLVAFFKKVPEPPERLVRGAEIVARRNPDVTIRHLDMKNFSRDLNIVRDLYNRAWEKNWGFVPMTEAEIDHMAKELKPAVDPELVLIAEKAGKPVGFSLTLPDLNQALKKANGRLFPFGLIRILLEAKKIHTLRVLTLGIVPEYRLSGIDAMLYLHIFRTGARKGYDSGEFSWMLEDNIAIHRPMENLGARIYRRYRLYDRPIPASAVIAPEKTAVHASPASPVT
jgi:GNAT superfamily N-acetyltransferase